MSLFEYGKLSVDLDFTDVDFFEKLETANEKLKEDCAKVPPTGKTSERLLAMVNAYDSFFRFMLGKEAVDKMFQGKKSGMQRIDALNKFVALEKQQGAEATNMMPKFKPNKNRQQRRNEQFRIKNDKSII